MMRFIMIWASALLTSHVWAGVDCSPQSQFLMASYDLQTRQGQVQRDTSLVLWRKGQLTAHQYPATEITESWYQLPNKQVKPMRFFDHFQRAIEYQPGEAILGRIESDWDYRNQLITKQFLSRLRLVKEQGEGCQKEQQLELVDGQRKIHLVWLPELHLVKQFTLNEAGHSERWQLNQLSFEQAAIEAFFAQREDYQTTDFADIGDDHTDPFLTNMVHQGFIEHSHHGVYQAESEMH